MPFRNTGKIIKATKAHDEHSCYGCQKRFVRGELIHTGKASDYTTVPAYMCEECFAVLQTMDDIERRFLMRGDIATFDNDKWERKIRTAAPTLKQLGLNVIHLEPGNF